MRATEHPLAVAGVERLTADAVRVDFTVPPELADAYRFVPGQHVAVRTAAAGDEARRVYSICSGPGAAVLSIGVKQLPDGGFSGYAAERIRPGDVVRVMTPTGRFCLTPPRDDVPTGTGRHIGCVAAGSGITPILPIITAALAAEPASMVTLLYGNRSTASVMFLEELADLKDRFPARFRIVHVLSAERPDVELLAGRIDRGKLRALVDIDAVDEWYLCGPRALMIELADGLAELGVHPERIHRELFHAGPTAATTPTPAQTHASAAASAPRAGDGVGGAVGRGGGTNGQGDGCEVTAILDGRRSTFGLEPGSPVLEGVLGVRSDAPFACRGGVCGTCRAKVVDGGVSMVQCYALEPAEVAQGFVLTCQSHPTTARLTVDYDA